MRFFRYIGTPANGTGIGTPSTLVGYIALNKALYGPPRGIRLSPIMILAKFPFFGSGSIACHIAFIISSSSSPLAIADKAALVAEIARVEAAPVRAILIESDSFGVSF